MSYILPSLSYPYDALEPYFDKETMEIHHRKHHQTYINNANSVLKDYPVLAKLSAEELISHLDQVPSNKRSFMQNNAGGHANHSFFWKNLKIGTVLKGALRTAIDRDFGSVHAFQEEFEKIAIMHFGSGWVWLVKQGEKLVVISTSNQDNPLMYKSKAHTSGLPIVGLDIWEHAYYLQYKNQRMNYVKAFWNVVNWDEASARFEKAVMCNFLKNKV